MEIGDAETGELVGVVEGVAEGVSKGVTVGVSERGIIGKTLGAVEGIAVEGDSLGAGVKEATGTFVVPENTGTEVVGFSGEAGEVGDT